MTGRRRGPLFLAIGVAAFVLVTSLFWWGTWFGKRLDDAALLEHLGPAATGRDVQHGLEEVTRRFDEGRPGMDRWAALVVEASRRPDDPVRVTAAWAMQYDARRPEFRERLREMVATDPSVLVRRNAATSLAAWGDPTGRSVLREMLGPVEVRALVGGRVASIVGVGRAVREGTLLARIEDGPGAAEVRAPVPGPVAESRFVEGAMAAPGATLVVLGPDPDHVMNAAHALGRVGTAEDVPLLLAAATPESGLPDTVREAARLAAAAIRAR